MKKSIAFLSFPMLALGAGLLLSTVGGTGLEAQMPAPPRPASVPLVTTRPAPALAAPMIIIPGQTASGTRLADTVIVQGTLQSGDFCTVTTREHAQTQTAGGTATASATTSVTVICDVTIVTTP